MEIGDDEDEVFTFRRPDNQTPSARLEEVVSAATLRIAKERLRRRGIAESAHQGDDSTVKTEPSASENESQPSESEDQESGGRQKRKRKAPAKTFRPVVATDDDVSYDLIRPSTRRIIEKIDNTLTILHNAQMPSAQHLDSEDSSSEVEDGHHESPQEMSRSRESSRPGSSPERSPRRSKIPTGDEADGSVKKKSNRGRPRKYVQREGESERDFEIRRAKALKGKSKFIPTDGDDEATTTAGEDQSSPRKRKSGLRRRRESMDDDREHEKYKKLKRANPRGWEDVIGAAALAGFSPHVVARAAQRCANLLGKSTKMHTIKETAASSGANAVETTTYQPGGEMPSSGSEAEEDADDLDLRQARSMSRHSSAAPSRLVSPASDDEEPEEDRASPKKSQKRAKPRGKGQHFCPYADCDRASDGFARPFNLKRHMKLVHGQDSLEVAEKEEAAADERLGGIHRDGFLKTIPVQKGWRAEDTKKRARKNI